MRDTISKLLKNQLREVFDELDYNRRGQITAVEIERFLNKYPAPGDLYNSGRVEVTHEDVEGFIRRFNKDKQNGRISLPEFIAEL